VQISQMSTANAGD